MNKICTTIEQSKKLIELGIDVNTANMCYCPIMNIDSGKNEGYLEVPECYPYSEVKDFLVPYLPTWSLNSLLNIIKNRHDCNKVELFSNYSCKWILITIYYDSVWKEKEIMAEDSVDAAFEMVCWLLENKKI